MHHAALVAFSLLMAAMVVGCVGVAVLQLLRATKNAANATALIHHEITLMDVDKTHPPRRSGPEAMEQLTTEANSEGGATYWVGVNYTDIIAISSDQPTVGYDQPLVERYQSIAAEVSSSSDEDSTPASPEAEDPSPVTADALDPSPVSPAPSSKRAAPPGDSTWPEPKPYLIEAETKGENKIPS